MNSNPLTTFVKTPGNPSVCPSPGQLMARRYSLASLIMYSASGPSLHKIFLVCSSLDLSLYSTNDQKNVENYVS